MFQMSGVGPMFGQLDHFARSAKDKIPYAIDRYFNETLRLLGILERRLGEAPFLAGESYSIADVATYPWLLVTLKGLRANAAFADKLPSLPSIDRWMATIAARPAVARGVAVPKRA
jgi:GST-like protein